MDGLANGEGKYSFVDGTEFSGTFVNGVVTGFGNFVTATGVVQRGMFNRYGSLHGPGLHAFCHSRVLAGEFREGALWGDGVEFANDGTL